MKRLLVLCPTRQRANRCKKMINSFLKTSSQAEMHLLLDWCDPELKEYMKIDIPYSVSQRMTNTARINQMFNTFQNSYDFYSVTNDDFVYETPDWDLKLMKLAQDGISYGDDCLQGKNMPTTSVISAKIVRALEWLQMPNLAYLYGDTVWKAIGQRLDILRYDPSVIIRHEHYFSKAVKKDVIYEHTNSKEMYKNDDQAFHLWLKSDFIDDCEKIKESLYAAKS